MGVLHAFLYVFGAALHHWSIMVYPRNGRHAFSQKDYKAHFKEEPTYE